MAKPRLTQAQHTELGHALAGIHDELLHRKVKIENAYPRTGPEALPSRKLDAVLRALNEARSALENAAFAEHPDTATTRDYYPHLEDRATVQVPGVKLRLV